MPESLIIANFKTGLETDREPFFIDNESFPVLNNAYVWRGRVLRKRGSFQLGRLRRAITSFTLPAPLFSSATTSYPLLTMLGLNVISPNAQLVPGFSIAIGAPDSQTLTDVGTGTLTITPPDATKITSATVNYQTGVLTLVWGGAVANSTGVFTGEYYPGLPVMGIEQFFTTIVNFPKTVFFDTVYAYQFDDAANKFYSVSFYKGTGAPVVWSGTDYQQFWSTNYSGAMWVTNAVAGWNFGAITAMTAATPAVITIIGHGLTTGDYVFINEVVWNNPTTQAAINGHTFQVTVLTANTFSIVLDTTTGGAYVSGGIAQYLNRSVAAAGAVTKIGDGIRWYDGDPTTTANSKGWVNFAPPITNLGVTGGAAQYLIGAKMILPFKGRLLFFGVTIATSAAPAGTYFPNRLISSQDGTPFYADPVPTYENQVSDPAAYYTNVVGRGFRLNAPIQEEIITLQENEDVLLAGYETKQLKLVFTFDDTLPFLYQTINSELGSMSTYSGVNLDDGAITFGDYGISITNQSSAKRIDLVIPDAIFDILESNNGAKRVTGVRDYRNEFIYFTYTPVDRDADFPTKTLLYNYRDNTWATLDENYTHYGTYRRGAGYTWATLPFRTWSAWSNPWNFGGDSAEYPNIVGGNQQGFVMIKDKGTREDYSQYITAMSGITITSPDHCLQDGDFIQINGVIGTAADLNQQIFQIGIDDSDPNHKDNFYLLNFVGPIGTYLGGGVYRRIMRPFIQTKMFPLLWAQGRKTRIGTQRLLLDTTFGGSLTMNVYTSMNPDYPANVPSNTGYPVFSNIVNTFPDTPPMNFYSGTGQQIWQRISNSFIGDTVQLGITLSDDQMLDPIAGTSEIAVHAIAFDLYPGPVLV